MLAFNIYVVLRVGAAKRYVLWQTITIASHMIRHPVHGLWYWNDCLEWSMAILHSLYILDLLQSYCQSFEKVFLFFWIINFHFLLKHTKSLHIIVIFVTWIVLQLLLCCYIINNFFFVLLLLRIMIAIISFLMRSLAWVYDFSLDFSSALLLTRVRITITSYSDTWRDKQIL